MYSTSWNDRQNHPCNKLIRCSATQAKNKEQKPTTIKKNPWKSLRVICASVHVDHLIPCVLPLESKYFQPNIQVNRIRCSHPNSQLYALNSLWPNIIDAQFSTLNVMYAIEYGINIVCIIICQEKQIRKLWKGYQRKWLQFINIYTYNAWISTAHRIHTNWTTANSIKWIIMEVTQMGNCQEGTWIERFFIKFICFRGLRKWNTTMNNKYVHMRN